MTNLNGIRIKARERETAWTPESTGPWRAGFNEIPALTMNWQKKPRYDPEKHQKSFTEAIRKKKTSNLEDKHCPSKFSAVPGGFQSVTFRRSGGLVIGPRQRTNTWRKCVKPANRIWLSSGKMTTKAVEVAQYLPKEHNKLDQGETTGRKVSFPKLKLTAPNVCLTLPNHYFQNIWKEHSPPARSQEEKGHN